MASFEAVEMDVVIKCRIVTYYPEEVVKNQLALQENLNEALVRTGKNLLFLPSPASVTIMQKEVK